MALGRTLILLLGIAVLSLTPDTASPGESAFQWLVHFTPTLAQKLLHVGIYAVLTVSLWSNLSLVRSDRVCSDKVRSWIAFFVAVGFGVLMEWLQTYVPGRYGSLVDVLFNAGGALIGAFAARRLVRTSFPQLRR